MLIRLDKNFHSTTGSLVNREDPRYMRIMWLNINPEWERVSLVQSIMFSMMIEQQDHPALMLDIGTICLS